ncbi:hypothetical protein O3P69_003255 [Scylla paramamosain]|uniref:Methyltransferase FkbM domain-containing protein n=2 Tax=Scylla paramamosain TaxID=85552 RepID=A0AAW0UK53_SCYPA
MVVAVVATVVTAMWLWLTVRERRDGKQEEKERTLEEATLRALGPMKASDPHLLRLLQERYLEPPFPGPPDLMLDRTGPEAERYNIYRTRFSSWMRTNRIIKTLFSSAPPGFFVEAGALDGEFISNTLHLERELGWTGLLVEADTTLYSALAGKRRRAWSSRGCLSPTAYPQELIFHGYFADASASVDTHLLVRSTGNLEGVQAPAAGQMGTQHRQVVQCFPLLSFLLAVNTTALQYVSLDVEGAEADILINLPWEEVDVAVWTIEHKVNTDKFKNIYEQPLLTSGTETSEVEVLNTSFKTTSSLRSAPVKAVTKVVYYAAQRDPSQGKDPYFIRFMQERGYVLYDYWDGDYTFIKRNSSICQRHCPA